MFLLPENINKIGSKTTNKKWKHHFPHHKTMGVFLDIQVQITPYYVVISGRNANSSLILCMSSIPTHLKWIGLIQSEKKWKHQFFRRLRAANFVVRGRIWPNFKLIQALMYIIVTCKYENDPIKNNREKLATPFSKLYHYLLPWKPVVGSGRISNSFKILCVSSLPASMKRIRWKMAGKCDDVIFSIISLWDFFQTLKSSQLHSPWSDLAKFRTHSSSYVYHRYLQV